MTKPISIDAPGNFSFKHTIFSHGWYDLAPFEADEENNRLSYVFTCKVSRKPVSAVLYDGNGKITVRPDSGRIDRKGLVRDVKHLLRLDEDLEPFYGSVSGEKRFKWVSSAGAGRLLRSPTVFEDLVKVICTTNCSWGLTKIMVTNLVDAIGEHAENGRKAFPTAEAMAAQKPEFYRDVMRAGYRAPYFVELAEKVASGELDPEQWIASDLPTPELKKEIKKVKGVGNYAAETMLKLVGRYDGLALDSWVRGQFYKKHNGGEPCDDARIEQFYDKFGEWKGLACWCDMTESWFD